MGIESVGEFMSVQECALKVSGFDAAGFGTDCVEEFPEGLLETLRLDCRQFVIRRVSLDRQFGLFGGGHGRQWRLPHL